MASPDFVGSGCPDGASVGRSGGKLGFYGLATNIVQPSGAAQAAITDGSGGTAAPTNGIAALTCSYNSTILAIGIASLAAQGYSLRSSLVNLGLIAGA